MRTPWRLLALLVLGHLPTPGPTSGLTAAPLQAAVRPTLPEFTADLQLTGGKALVDFFETRAKSSDCQTELGRARKLLNKKEAALKEMVSAKAGADIEPAEKDTESVRVEYLALLDRCGPCAIREVEKRKIVTAKSTETWYLSDGTCYLDPVKFGKPVYDRLVAHLSKVDAYPAYRGGLRNILEFLPVDSEKGIWHPEWTAFDHPFFVFVAVKGPQILGETLSMQYLIQNTFVEKNEQGGQYWGLSYHSVRAPRDFHAPEVYVHKANGKKRIARTFSINSVIGQWQVDSRGFFRYFTAADFGTSIPFAATIAKSVLLDTLAHVYERGTEEKP